MQSQKPNIRQQTLHGAPRGISYSPKSSPSTKDYEKLRRKMWEMKHRVCLLEFGLGSVAKLMEEFGGSTSVNNGDQDLTNNGKCKRALRGIGEILYDIENCMKASHQQLLSLPARLDSSTYNVHTAGTSVINPHAETVCQPRKARVFIDETTSGGNSLTVTTPTDICNIQVLENPIFLPSLSSPSGSREQQKCITTNENPSRQFSPGFCIPSGATPNPIMTPSFDALSTLASVAASKQAEEAAMNMTRSHEPLQTMGEMSSGGETRDVNPFIFSEETGQKVTLTVLKKRRRVSMNTSTSPSSGGRSGMSTRRMSRQGDTRFQK